MANMNKATPRPIFNGFRDSSRNPLPAEREQLPTYLPHILGFAAQGPYGPRLGGGGTLKQTFGSDTFDPTTVYASHANVLAADLMGRQQIFFERLEADGSATAKIMLAIEMVWDNIPDYVRDADGNYMYDENGEPKQLGFYDSNGEIVTPAPAEGDTIVGTRYRWLLNPMPSNQQQIDDAIANGTPVPDPVYTAATAGGISNFAAGEILPILTATVSYAGSRGSNLGVRFQTPMTGSGNPPDTTLLGQIKAFLYGLQVVQFDATGKATTLPTLLGDGTVNGTFKPDVLNPVSNAELSITNNFVPAYRQVGVPGQTDIEGPFVTVEVNAENFATVINRIALLKDKDGVDMVEGTTPGTYPAGAVKEADNDYVSTGPGTSTGYPGRTGINAYADFGNVWMMNILTGVDINGVPYRAAVIDPGHGVGTPARDGEYVAINNTSVLRAAGGDDGDISQEALDAKVRAYFENYNNPLYYGADKPLYRTNMAKYPWSDYIDTGFSINTKKRMIDIVALRPDIKIMVSTQELSKEATPNDVSSLVPNTMQNTLTVDQDNADLLSSYIRSIPESVVYGTDNCRVMLAQHAGYLLNSPYKKLVTLTHELSGRRSAYMGSGDGIWKQGQSFQKYPLNTIQSLAKLNHTWRTDTAFDAAWDTGCIYVQSCDMSTDFIPAWRTVYRYADSVLLSVGFVDCCVEATKVLYRTWVQLVGRDDLTDLEFKAESDRIASAQLQRTRFDNRYVCVPETIISADDSARGWSWQTVVGVYGNKMKLVGTFTVDGRNMSDLPAQG